MTGRSKSAAQARRTSPVSPVISARRDLMTGGIVVAAILMFVGTGSTFVHSMLNVVSGIGGSVDELLASTLLLNIALVLFGAVFGAILGPAVFGPLFAAAVGAELCIAFIASGLKALDTQGADIGVGFGAPAAIGELLLTTFLVAFEAASFLLLVAAVGAVVLARRRRGLEEEGPAVGPRRDQPTDTLEVRA